MTSSPAQEMHSNQNRKSLYFLVNQVKDFQAAQGKKKKRKLEDKRKDTIFKDKIRR